LDKQNARTQTKTKTCSLHVPPGNQYSNMCHDIDDSQTKNISCLIEIVMGKIDEMLGMQKTCYY